MNLFKLVILVISELIRFSLVMHQLGIGVIRH